MMPFLIRLTGAPAHAALDAPLWIRPDLILKIATVTRSGQRRAGLDAFGHLVSMDDPDRLLTEISLSWLGGVKEILVAEGADEVAALVNTRALGPPQVFTFPPTTFAVPCGAEGGIRPMEARP